MEKILDFKDETTYRFQCDCLTPTHALDVTIMSKGKADWVELVVWRDADSLGRRLKWAWKMLRTGLGFEGEVILREEDVPELRKILEERL